jgi:hypothetical protein
VLHVQEQRPWRWGWSHRRVSTNELLNLGTNGTVLTVNALTIYTTNYTKGGTYTTHNKRNGYGNPGANVTGDGAIYLVTPPVAAGADRGDPGEALQTRSDREEPRLGVSRDQVQSTRFCDCGAQIRSVL